MSKFWFILFFKIVCFSEIVAQTFSDLFLPLRSEDVVMIKIPENSNFTGDLGYDYLSVHVSNETNEYTKINCVQGIYLMKENNLTFKPIFPFEKGLPYIVKYKNLHSNEVSYTSFQIGEKEKINHAKVLSIFPSANYLPENLLRFYIYFQTPMKQEEALKHLKLIDNKGNVDEHAFMKFKEELWSRDGKRLTILFDPSRIKRGVSSNLTPGPSLENGNQYHLSISGEWQDVYGQKLLENTKKKIRVVKAYRKKIKIKKWTVIKPTVNSFDKLYIHLDRIIDHALIQSMIRVRDRNEKTIKGYWEVLDNEERIQFVPQNKWKKGKYKIEFDTRLEDISGNNLQNLLDSHKTTHGNNERFQFIDFIIL